MEITLPHPVFILSAIAAMGAGYIVRWILEENGFDFEEWLRGIFKR